MSRTIWLLLIAIALLGLSGQVGAWDYVARVSVASNGTQGNGYSDAPSTSADGRYIAFESLASNLVPGDTNGKTDVFVYDRITGNTTRASVDSAGNQANGGSFFIGSWDPAISADGRFVVFESMADDLVTGDTNHQQDIFVHDRNTGQTTRVNVDSFGNEAFSGGSDDPVVSADGRFIAFESEAINLVPGDTNGNSDIFVHDRNTGNTTRVSIDSYGAQVVGFSYYPSVSSDGRFIAFNSRSGNLVPGDTNGLPDIFIHDRTTSSTTRVNLATGGINTTGGDSRRPSISANGSLVAFDSYAINLVPGDSNSVWDIFVRSRVSPDTTTRVSVATGGTQAIGGDSEYPSISSDGRYVAFQSNATNLVTGDTNGRNDIFVHDRTTGVTGRLSVASGGVQVTGDSERPAISGDGRYVAFVSGASDLVPGDTNGYDDVFIHTDAIRHNVVFRPSAYDNWIFTDNLGTVRSRDHYGMSTDKPLAGDFNNDGVTDRAVFRNGNWIVDYSMDRSVNSNTAFGMAGDIPLVGYFNSDRITDRAVFRNGQWIEDWNMDGSVDRRTSFGMAGDVPLVGDIQLDGNPDRVVYRNGQWIVDLNMDGSVDSRTSYGLPTDIPVMGWIDGNTIIDRAVFRNGEWIIDYGMDGSVDWRPRFGTAGDKPLSWVDLTP